VKHATLAALVLLSAVAPATVFAATRSPQVAVTGGTLQGYLNVKDGGVDVDNAQENIQTWRKTVSGNSAFTLQIALGSAQGNEIGIYDASQAFAPRTIFPASAPAGWFAVASFRTTNPQLIVNLFDEQGQHQTRTTFASFNGENFGFYIQHDSDTGLSEDSKNPGSKVRALTYQGQNANAGCWWLCFEDNRDDGDESADYDDAVLLLESVNASPVTKATWAAVKNRFR
jgi:hypothetical protein